MKAYYADGALALEFDGSEKEMLILTLVEAFNLYEADPKQLPERLQKYWAGRLSSTEDPALADAAADLKEARLAWRSDRAKALERWLGPEGNLTNEDDALFALDNDDIDLFLAILNERRLLLAAAQDIGEAQMDLNLAALPTKELQRAVWEIHFLAFIMENCLRAIEER